MAMVVLHFHFWIENTLENQHSSSASTVECSYSSDAARTPSALHVDDFPVTGDDDFGRFVLLAGYHVVACGM